MFIAQVRNTDPALSTENNATSPKGTGTAQVRPPAADGLPGHPCAPPLEPSSLPPKNSMLPGTSVSPKRPERTAQSEATAIVSQLVSHGGPVQVQGESHAPVANATEPLLALQSLCATLNAEQRTKVNEQLQTAIHASAHLPIDQKLLGEIVADVVHAPEQPLHQRLADKTFQTLGQHKLQMKNDGEVEPGSLVYNSILPDLAGCTDDRGALCRTLLWEGACQLFAGGPRQEQRRENFKTVIFSLNVPKSELPFQLAADLKLDELKLYELDVNPR